ncbi:MAG TPA: hypothetical protein VJ872_12910 [Nocardioides sp.]|nr:hypothetical protein [Nocardioides sp.]
MKYDETKTVTPREEKVQRPVSARGKGLMVLLAIAAVVYVVIGFRYAAGHTLLVAGMSGPASWAGYGAQVLGWPVMALTH